MAIYPSDYIRRKQTSVTRLLFDSEEQREGAVVVSAMATDEQVRLSIRPVCPAQIDPARKWHPRIERKLGHDRHVLYAARRRQFAMHRDSEPSYPVP